MPADQQTRLRLTPRTDLEQLAREYAANARVQVADLLALSSADAIYHALAAHRAWNLVYIDRGRHVDSNALAFAQWPLDKRRRLERAIYRQAQHEFQYFFASVPIYDIYHDQALPGHFFNSIVEFLNSPKFLDLVRAITGSSTIAFADAQATRYEPGQFLTCHDDAVDGKNRLVAYVLNLTPVWRPDWGGALQFIGPSGNVDAAFTPAYNVLNLFRVPTDHSVGIVAPFAATPRYAITGWLRSGSDPRAK